MQTAQSRHAATEGAGACLGRRAGLRVRPLGLHVAPASVWRAEVLPHHRLGGRGGSADAFSYWSSQESGSRTSKPGRTRQGPCEPALPSRSYGSLIVRSLSKPPVSPHNSRNPSPRSSAPEVSRLQAFRGLMTDLSPACHAEGRGVRIPSAAFRKAPHLRGFLVLGALARPARFEGFSAESGFSPETPRPDQAANASSAVLPSTRSSTPGAGPPMSSTLLVDAHRELGVAVPEQVHRPPRRYPDLRQQRGKGPP